MDKKDLVNVLEVKHVLIENFLTILSGDQCKHSLFKASLNQLCVFLAYEALRYFAVPLSSIDLVSPSGETVKDLKFIRSDRIALIAMMRGGLEPASAINAVLPQAPLAQVSTKGGKDGKPARVFYERWPKKLHEKRCLVVAPRIETGSSVLAVLKRIRKLRKDKPMSEVIIINAVIAPQGAEKLLKAFPEVRIVTASIGRDLKDGVVVPGIGRTGQRMYKSGSKEAGFHE